MTGLIGLTGRRRRRPPPQAPTLTNDPFAELGLDPAADLTDDEVRVAWRRIAAATHPDRADGGDPGRFATAAAAYTELRTRYGRGEARAVLASVSERGWTGEARASGPDGAVGPRRHGWLAGRSRGAPLAALADVGARVRSGRPARLVARVLAVAVIAVAVVVAAGPGPSAPALVTGALTWLALSVRQDLGPPPPARRR